jgi:hypothetical protein
MRIVTIVLLFISCHVFAQQNITLSGFVFDEQNGEVLIGANIYESHTKIGCSSNEFGFYSLTLPKSDSIYLLVSFIGYEPYSVAIKGESKSNLNLYLNSGIVLSEVDVRAKKTESIVEKNETGVVRLQISEIKQMPSLFGEVDIIKAYQLTPGVQSGGEAKSNIYVRGGSPDQNLILLDDVPLYYVSHFGGFFSVFNADAINDVKLIKGGFPARYGGRLSSVLDIRMNDGNYKEYKTQGTIGLLSSKISFEGPLKKDKSSFIISARKNLVPLFRMLGAGISYNFYDVNSKLNFKLSEKDRLFFSFYMGNDVIGLGNNTSNAKQKNNAVWGNTLVAFRWNHVYNSKLFSNLTLSDTYYRYKNVFEYKIDLDSIQKEMSNSLLTGINDLGLKMDFTYLLNSKNNFRFGFNSILHNFIPNDEKFYQSGSQISTIDLSYNSKSQAIENAAYAEYELKYGFLNGNFGARYSTYLIENKFYHYLEPRAILNLIFSETFSAKASYSESNQFVHLLSYSGSGMPSDYWMPSNANVAPQNSEQYSVGLAKTFHNNMFELSLESYYKSLEKIIDFKPGESLLGNLDSWENVIEMNGIGENYGIELFLQKLTGKTTGWIGATVSKAERQFENINNGNPYPYTYDRLLDFSVVINQRIKENITLSATWTYGTGYPITLATEHYFINDQDIFVYGEKNSFRMRDYHRLDISANFTKRTEWGERTWNISIFNVYNRKNPYYYYYAREYEDIIVYHNGSVGNQTVLGELKLMQRSLFSFFPSIAYSFKF